MELRPYQMDAKKAIQQEWINGNRKTLLVLPTGTGKTIVFSKLAEDCVRDGERVLILAHRGELLDQAADKLSKATGLGCAVEKAESTCLDSWYRVVVGSVQSLMRESRLSKFTPHFFSSIIVDEAHHCCPAGTMIDGVPIENLSIGDLVSAYNHESGCIVKRRITAKMINPAPDIYEIFLSDGSKICCTANHPMWNGAEYIPASSLQVNNFLWKVIDNEGVSKIYKTKTMFNLWKNLCAYILELKNDSSLFAGMQRQSERKPAQESKCNMSNVRERICHSRQETLSSKYRENFLFKAMQQRIQSIKQFYNNVKNKSKIRLGTYEKEQPYEERICAAQNAKGVKGETVCSSHGKRTIHATSDVITQSIDHGNEDKVCARASNKNHGCETGYRRIYSQLLQSGYCLYRMLFGNRGGWEKPCDSQRKRTGCFENESIIPVRVARIKIHKQTNRRGFKKLCPDGKVYNIEVEKDNNYFANRILVHNCLSDSYQRVLSYFDEAKVLGVTATPDRSDMRNLGSYFQSLAYEYTLPKAIKDGYLSPIKAQTIPLTLDLTGVGQQAGDFKTSDLGTALDPYLYQIAEEMAKSCMDRKTLVFLPLVKTSRKFRNILESKGFSAAEVNGNSQDRAEVLADFESGRYNVLCNSMLLTEGYDCPSIDCVVVLRPTKIRSLYSQMVGRGTRLHPGKDHLLLLDFLWHTERHELCHPAHLICESEDVAEQMTKNIEESGCPVDLEEAEVKAKEDVVEARERALAQALAEMKRRKRALVDPLQFEMSIQAEDLASYQPAFGWEMGPPSDKQLAALEKAGICPDDIESAGKAAKILDRLSKRRAEDLTTPKQIRFLEGRGFQHVGRWQFASAKRLIDRIAGNSWRVPHGIDPYTYRPEENIPAEIGWGA